MRKNIIEALNNNRLLNETTMHFDDYVKELLDLQNAITVIACDRKENEFIRLDDAIVRLQSKASEKGLNKNPEFCKGIKALRDLNKEIAICMSGKKGEHKVAKSLEYVNRDNVYVFKNVYLTDGQHSTEIDDVILTDTGIIVLEVKSTKDNITITEEGRLFYSDDQCYERYPIGQKMGNKRNLLRYAIEQQLEDKGIDIDLIIDSYIVFSAPKGVHLLIDDFYKKEKYCRQGKLQHIIREYESGIKYSVEEMNVLKGIMETLKTSQKGFEIKLNYNELVDDFFEMMEVLNQDEEDREAVVPNSMADRRQVFIDTAVKLRRVAIDAGITGYIAGKVIYRVASGLIARKVY